jgi:hypothetical protein
MVIPRCYIPDLAAADSDLIWHERVLMTAEETTAELILFVIAPDPDIALGVESQYMVTSAHDLGDLWDASNPNRCFLCCNPFTICIVPEAIFAVGVLE